MIGKYVALRDIHMYYFTKCIKNTFRAKKCHAKER